MNMTKNKLRQAINGYIECALWSSVDDNDKPLNLAYDDSDLEDHTFWTMRQDVKDFIKGLNAADGEVYLQEYGASNLGHDFWLTRNRHGVGFWDRALDDIGERLTDEAHAYGTYTLWVNDGVIYGE